MSQFFDEVSLSTAQKGAQSVNQSSIRRVRVPLAFASQSQTEIPKSPVPEQLTKVSSVQNDVKKPLEILLENAVSQQREGASSINVSQHPSPPPIYSAFYPPGAYPAGQVPATFMCSGAGSGRQAYIINAGELGVPTYILGGDQGQQQSPVYIISGSYNKFARRRRVLAFLTFFLLIFPIVVFFMIMLHTR